MSSKHASADPGSEIPYSCMSAAQSSADSLSPQSGDLSALPSGVAESGEHLPQPEDADGSAGLDMRFIADLWVILHLAIDKYPLSVTMSELGFVAACTALSLWLMPIPLSFGGALSEHCSFGMLVGIGVVMALTLVRPLCHLASVEHTRAPIAAHIRRHSLSILFLSVQMNNIAGFYVSIVPSLVYQALTATPRECGALPLLLIQATGYICAVTLCKVLMSLVQESSALLWRQALTKYLHELYLRRSSHYHLGLLCPSLDNPDQRIAREVDLWANSLAGLLVTISTSIYNVIWYTIQTWMITGWT